MTALFDMVNGRRAGEGYTADEQRIVEELIEEVAGLRAEWAGEELPGLWHLAYLTPGPDGATVDRRIPFPEASPKKRATNHTRAKSHRSTATLLNLTCTNHVCSFRSWFR